MSPGLGLVSFATLLLMDLMFLVVVGVPIYLLARRKRAAFAVLKRNFLGYFSNPTGYVFLCLFVLLTSMAAFWPHEFFSSNLATLGQLNKWFPIIMLFFIPAITMSIWAEERRQGTDELLLTLPADDFDIVIGKYLSAGAIYTASLLFSQISTFLVLVFLTLGNVDTGLFFANYLGYWCIGMAMIAIGMIASFLTNNLTVGFILGALFNAPLAFASMSDVIAPNRAITRMIKGFSITERFDDFGRGVISLSSLAYFILLAIVGLYLCMVLIGRRHWSGGKEGNTMFLHYFTRILLLGAIAVLGSFFFRNNDQRQDVTVGRVSSISPTTREMIRTLKPERPIVVDAYLSGEVPEAYSKTKYELISMLKEFESVAKANKVPLEVRINDNLESISEEAKLAEEQYGITPNRIRVRERGTMSDQNVILGVAFRSGLEKVVVPFFGSGVPVEYELIRSLNTVSKPSRKKLGVLKTDAQMAGGFSMANFQQLPKQAIINELSKQYEIVDIDPASAIASGQCDVLLAVQPSSLSPEQMVNFIDAVKSGIPTAIFEDPKAVTFGFPGTGEPKQQQGGMFGGQPPQPKGDIRPLWKTLGLRIEGVPSPMIDGIHPDLCWQRYNPYPILADLDQANDLWLFIREETPGDQPAFSPSSEISNGLRELLFLYAGTVAKEDGRDDIEFLPLVQTGINAGRISFDKLDPLMQRGEDSAQRIRLLEGEARGEQTIAALIRGKQPTEQAGVTEGSSKPVHVVYVADADCLFSVFVDIRNRPDQFEDFNFRLQNVPFVLNCVDILAGDPAYASVRRHEPQHSTLRLVEMRSEEARLAEAQNREKFRSEFDQARGEAEAEVTKAVTDFQERVQKLQKQGATDPGKQRELLDALTQLRLKQDQLNRKLAVKVEQMERDRDKKIGDARREADLQIRGIQNRYKMLAVFLPPIPPLLVGIIVFVSRRLKEREGISKTRLR